MKRTFILLAVSLLGPAGVVAQGNVVFNNKSAPLATFLAPIYGAEPGDPASEKHGNTAAGGPAGSQVYNGPLLAGTGFTVQLWGHIGGGMPVSSLTPLGTAVFRTGTAAGYINTLSLPGGNPGIYVPNTPYDGAPYSGTFQVRAWDNMGGAITDWSQVLANPQILRGASEVITVGPLGFTGTPPATTPYLIGMTSFNLHTDPGPGGLLINDILVAEGASGTVNAVFSVRLAFPSTQVITVDYATADGTALAGSDYVATNGTLTFLPGETNKTITVAVTADVDPEPDESFTVILSNPVNATIPRNVGTATITEAWISSLAVDVSISFHTVLGHVYALEKTDVLMTQPWTTVAGATNIVATGGTVTVVDRGSGCDTGRIYRARLIQ